MSGILRGTTPDFVIYSEQEVHMNTVIELLLLPIVCVLSVIAGLMEME